MQLLRSMCVTAKFDTAQRKMSEDTVVVLHYIYCTKQQTLYLNGICVQVKVRDTVSE